LLEKLSNLDGRIVYGILLVSMVLPLLNPLGLPLTTPAETVAMYDMIESMPEGSPIVFSMDCGAAGFDEISPGATAVISHMARKGLRVIGVSFVEAGSDLLNKLFDASLMSGKEYGKDYVNLGYLAGGENAMAAAAKDLRAMYPVDFSGSPTSGMQVLSGVNSFTDVKMVICAATGSPGIPEWIRQVGDPLKVPIATVVIAGLVADYAPYLQAKQLVGLVPGLRGAAGYEGLIGILGRGMAGIDAQSVAHLVILLLVVLGNAVYFANKRKSSEKGAKA